jgi:hypothetical protein
LQEEIYPDFRKESAACFERESSVVPENLRSLRETVEELWAVE